jgi:hypothetical protein
LAPINIKHKRKSLKCSIQSSHTGAITQQELAELHFEVLKHPAYLSHLAPSNYHVFPNLKKHLKEMKFSTSEDVMYVVDDWFASQHSAFYLDGLTFKNRASYI